MSRIGKRLYATRSEEGMWEIRAPHRVSYLEAQNILRAARVSFTLQADRLAILSFDDIDPRLVNDLEGLGCITIFSA